jgi:hypothetical protein
MDALRELFTTWIGLLSLGTILGIFVIGGFMLRMVLKKIDESKPPAS